MQNERRSPPSVRRARSGWRPFLSQPTRRAERRPVSNCRKVPCEDAAVAPFLPRWCRWLPRRGLVCEQDEESEDGFYDHTFSEPVSPTILAPSGAQLWRRHGRAGDFRGAKRARSALTKGTIPLGLARPAKTGRLDRISAASFVFQARVAGAGGVSGCIFRCFTKRSG